MQELIEKMALSGVEPSLGKFSLGYKPRLQIAEQMLSVIKENIHLVARVCPECDGLGVRLIYDTTPECSACKGYGIIAIDKEEA